MARLASERNAGRSALSPVSGLPSPPSMGPAMASFSLRLHPQFTLLDDANQIELLGRESNSL